MGRDFFVGFDSGRLLIGQMTTDHELLRDYAATGSEAAFTELVGRYTDLVYSAALRQVGEPEAARDVTQGVFVDLARKAAKLNSDTLLAGWLYRSTRYAVLNELRSRKRRQERERQAMQLLDSGSETAPDWEQIAPLLDEAIASLGEQDRDALLLRFFRNESLASVGNFFGTSEDTAQKRVSRALDKLRNLLVRRGVKATAGGLAVTLLAHSVQAAPAEVTVSLAASALGAAAKPAATSFLSLAGWKAAAAGTATAGLVALVAVQLKPPPPPPPVATGVVVIDDLTANLGLKSRLFSVEFSPDGKWLVTCGGWVGPREAGELVVWDAETRKERLVWRQFHPFRSAVFTRDGRQLLAGDFGGNTRLVNPATGAVLATLPVRQGIINYATFSPDERQVLFCSFDGTVTVWDVATKKTQHVFAVPGEKLTKLAVSPDGNYLATVSWLGKAHVWNLAKRQKLHTLTVSQPRPDNPEESIKAEAIVFTPDSRSFLTTGQDGRVQLWSAATGQLIRRFEGHEENAVLNALFTRDGRRLLTSDGTGKVILWDVEKGAQTAVLETRQPACFGLALSSDGKRLATASWDYTAKIWNAETLELVGVCRRDTGNGVAE